MTSRSASDLARRNLVLEAALPLLARHGYHGASIPEIAKKAGVATGSVYRHFEGKSHLANVLLREHYTALKLALHALATDASVADMLHMVLAFAERNRAAFDYMFLFDHRDFADPETRAHRAQLDAVVGSVVEAQWRGGSSRNNSVASQGDPPAPAAALAAEIFWGACTFVVRGLRNGSLAGVRDVDSLVERLVCHGLSTPP